MLKHIYIAAPREESPRARRMAGSLHARGFSIVSSWFRELREVVDPPEVETKRAIRLRNRNEIARSDLLVALTDRGTPRETYIEIGYALECCVPVVWLQGSTGEGGCLSDAEPLVSVVRAWEEVGGVVEALWRKSHAIR